MRQYGKYAKPYLSAFILGPIFMIVEVLGEVALPRLMSVIINYGCGEAPGTEARGTGFILLIGAVMILTALLMMLGIFCSEGVGELCRGSAARRIRQGAEILLCQY